MAGIGEPGQLGRPLAEVLPWIPEPAVRRALETGAVADDIELGGDDPAALARRFAVTCTR